MSGHDRYIFVFTSVFRLIGPGGQYLLNQRNTLWVCLWPGMCVLSASLLSMASIIAAGNYVRGQTEQRVDCDFQIKTTMKQEHLSLRGETEHCSRFSDFVLRLSRELMLPRYRLSSI